MAYRLENRKRIAFLAPGANFLLHTDLNQLIKHKNYKKNNVLRYWITFKREFLAQKYFFEVEYLFLFSNIFNLSLQKCYVNVNFIFLPKIGIIRQFCYWYRKCNFLKYINLCPSSNYYVYKIVWQLCLLIRSKHVENSNV